MHGNLSVESCLFEDRGPWADVRIVDAGLKRSASTPMGLGGFTAESGPQRTLRLVSDGSKSGDSKKGTVWGVL